MRRKERFSEPMSLKQLGAMSKGVVPAEKNTRRAVNTFETWLHSCYRRLNDIFAPNLLKVTRTDSKGQTELCCALWLFVIEARKSDGKLSLARTV